jgi:hypothetical protein
VQICSIYCTLLTFDTLIGSLLVVESLEYIKPNLHCRHQLFAGFWPFSPLGQNVPNAIEIKRWLS